MPVRSWQAKGARETGTMDIEDLEPRKPTTKPKDLDAMGVEELQDYLASLQTEVERVKAKIESKQSYLSGAQGFFKS